MSKATPYMPGLRLQDRALRSLIWVLLCLPYAWRVRLCGWLLGRVIGPLAGYDRRVRENLARILPDLPARQFYPLSLKSIQDLSSRELQNK